MVRALIPLQTDFEELEAIAIIDILRRANVSVTTVSLAADKLVTGSHHISIMADSTLDAWISEQGPSSYDAIILPGGPGTPRLAECAPLLDVLRTMNARGCILGAICAAPTVLSRAGILATKKATSYPRAREQVHCAQYQEDAVVVDGNCITSRAAGTAVAFGLALVEALVNEQEATRVADAILFHQ
ncbi:putative DJ-1 family protein [Paratrimastix pyriformis]|uniref:DJ-1 family protein n=1 Tax=Paratrimastix pyriformis TaxID=342808 RepID=A0ABQ8UM94_9EUKA|nr:putative DJ-1 family protein [Paratrimastix pyriformis]